MYCEAFNLREKPFSLASDPRYLYMSEQHWEAMAHLMYGVQDDWGFVLITGEIGTGKTTLCRLLLDQMPADVEVAFLLNPKLTVQELLVSICDEFHIQPSSPTAGTKELFDRISTRLLDIHASARKALLIIDEAQYLSSEVIDELRLLTNLETEGGKLLRIILLGQPELRNNLAKPELEQMSQRITARYHLGPLSKKEIAAYVSHRMKLAGAEKQFFTPSAIRALFRMSRGVPRLINVICERALLGACLKKDDVVTRSTLIQAGREVLRGARSGDRMGRLVSLRWAAAILAVILLGAFLLVSGYNALVLKAASVTQLPLREEHVHAASSNASGIAWWPVGLGLEQSRDAAYRGLLAMKGLSYDSSGTLDEDAVCSTMELFNLQCVDRREAARDIRTMPGPMVMRLFDIHGGDLFVTLQAIQGAKALLRIGNAEKEVAVSDLRNRWTGQYTTLEAIGTPDTMKQKVIPIAVDHRKD